MLLTTLVFRWNLPEAASTGRNCVTHCAGHKLTHLADAFPVRESDGEQEEKGGTCVCSPMSLQFVAACEPLATKHPAADKRSLPRVPAQVCSQVRRLPVHFPAAHNVADVLLLLTSAGSAGKRDRENKGNKNLEVKVLGWFIQRPRATCAYSPSTRLFAVGARARHPAQPFALLTQRVLVIHQTDAEVGQIAGVQGGVGAQLPLSRVGLLLYPDVWGGEHI